VVVEVKARKELANGQSIAALESVLRDQPGRRFELIIEGQLLSIARHSVQSKFVLRWRRRMSFGGKFIWLPPYFCCGPLQKQLCAC